MTRVFYASTLFGTMSLAAAVDAGLFGDRTERRLLITSNNAAVPEIVDRFDTGPAFDALRSRFDDVVHWNEVISPLHPSAWVPRAAEIPMLTRMAELRLGLLDNPASELVVESIAVAPARTLGILIPDCPVTVFSDGLMSYGPTRDEVDSRIAHRIGRLLYLDLVPGITPLLLREFGVQAQPIPDAAFTKVLNELPSPQTDSDVTDWPMVVGQYLSALEILTPTEEVMLYTEFMRALVARGHEGIVFAPHPGSGSSQVRAMQRAAQQLGVRLVVAGGGLPVEAWFGAFRPALVVSCFSTALVTARRWFDLPVACGDTADVLNRIVPYQNSNRVPATLIDATTPRLGPDGNLVEPPHLDVQLLLRAVGYCMQSTRNAYLRDDAVRFLRTHGPQRYFKRRRLYVLRLAAPPKDKVSLQRGGLQIARRGVTRTLVSARRASSAARTSIRRAREGSS